MNSEPSKWNTGRFVTRQTLLRALALLALLFSALPLFALEIHDPHSDRTFLNATALRLTRGAPWDIAQASAPQPESGLGHGPVVPQGPYNTSPGTPTPPATPSMIYWCLNEKTWLYEPCKPPEPTFKPPKWKEQVPGGHDKPKL